MPTVMAEDVLLGLWVLLGYLLGAIPFGVLVTKALGKADPRATGSRNIGFTNVLRGAGALAGLLTLMGDMGKGWLVGWASTSHLSTLTEAVVVSLSPIAGHLFSIFLCWKGGKGVATAFGVLLGLDPRVGLAVLVVWILTAAVSRYSSGAAIAAFVMLPLVAMWLRPDPPFVMFCLLVSGLVLARHTSNIVRLWQGTEPRLGGRVRGTHAEAGK